MTGHTDEIAEKCLQIYRNAMGAPALQSTEEFAHAGGDSVKAVLIATELEIAFGVEIPMATFFEKKTVAEMSDWLSRAEAHPNTPTREIMSTTKIASADQPGLSLSDAESAIRTIWTDILGDEAPQEIGLDDDFFEIGGTSLSLITVVARMSERFGAELPTAIVVNGATIREMAKSALEELATAKA